MTIDRLEEIRRRNGDSEWAPDRQECAELLAEVDRLRGAVETLRSDLAEEPHNTLARRAEIGALVERLIDGRCLSVEDSGGDWITANLVLIVDGREVELGEVQGEVGLLDALRALAKEVNGD